MLLRTKIEEAEDKKRKAAQRKVETAKRKAERKNKGKQTQKAKGAAKNEQEYGGHDALTVSTDPAAAPDPAPGSDRGTETDAA